MEYAEENEDNKSISVSEKEKVELDSIKRVEEEASNETSKPSAFKTSEASNSEKQDKHRCSIKENEIIKLEYIKQVEEGNHKETSKELILNSSDDTGNKNGMFNVCL